MHPISLPGGKSLLLSLFIPGLLFLVHPLFSQEYIADSYIANELAIRRIPIEYINKARTELVIAYQHTSHGTHVSRGVFGLQDYKTGDTLLFGVSLTPDTAKLEFRDLALADYAPAGIDAADLSRDETAFIQTTRNYLDAPENATVNVVMWSWCDISGHDVTGNYLPGMDSLIAEYGPGGSKIGIADTLRELPVTFIYMTGHANENANTGALRPMEQAAVIVDSCKIKQQFCLDYYSIDTHDMDNNYYEDAGDDGDSDTYGGNFYRDWQNTHTLGEHYYENKVAPGGGVDYGEHNTQHITANRKAYAFWWILARIAGFEGNYQVTDIQLSSEGDTTEMMTGDSLQFYATVLPEFASNPVVDWSVISDTASATISGDGFLIGGLPGMVEVVALATDGSGVGDTMALTINPPLVPVMAITVSIAGGVSELNAGFPLQCSATVLPEDASNPAVIWSVDNIEGSAMINAEGLVTGLTDGLIEVIATANDGSPVADTLQLTVVGSVVFVTDIEISSAGNLTNIEIGGDLQFSATVLPDIATNPALVWSVVNGTGTASISSGGLLTGLTEGTVNVVAAAVDGSGTSDSFALTIDNSVVLVMNIAIESAGGNISVEQGNTLQFTATVLPANATNPLVAWSVVDGTGSASISSGGLLTGLTAGTVAVVAMAQDGSGIGDAFALTVNAPSGLTDRRMNSMISVYPNPSPGLFYLDVGDLSIKKIEVVSAEGSVVLELLPRLGEDLIEVDLSDQQPGALFIRAFSKEQFSVHRVIIIR